MLHLGGFEYEAKGTEASPTEGLLLAGAWGCVASVILGDV